MSLYAYFFPPQMGGLVALFPKVQGKWPGLVKTLLTNRFCVQLVLPNYVNSSVRSEHVQGKLGRAGWRIMPVQ